MSPAALKALFQGRPPSPEQIAMARRIADKAERASKAAIRRMNKRLETFNPNP